MSANVKLVKATERGYFGALREPGTLFRVPKDHKARWFKDVEEPTAAKKPAAKAKAKGEENVDDLV